MALEEKGTNKALLFWEQRYSRPLTSEDVRQIQSNVTSFFVILQEWCEKEEDAEATAEVGRLC